MLKQPIVRVYAMSDAELLKDADLLSLNLKRDLADFSKRNVTIDKLKAFANLIEVFSDTSTDEEMLGYCMAATEEKDRVAELLRSELRGIRNMADLAFNGKGIYNVFGFEGLSSVNDMGLYLMAKRVKRMATKHFAELAVEGLTNELLANLDTCSIAAESAIAYSGSMIENREIETQIRVNTGNILYAELMRLASIGKTLYDNKDGARYNDYVIIGSKGEAKVKNEGKAEGESN